MRTPISNALVIASINITLQIAVYADTPDQPVVSPPLLVLEDPRLDLSFAPDQSITNAAIANTAITSARNFLSQPPPEQPRCGEFDDYFQGYPLHIIANKREVHVLIPEELGFTNMYVRKYLHKYMDEGRTVVLFRDE